MTYEEQYIVLSVIIGVGWFWYLAADIKLNVGILDVLNCGSLGLLMAIFWPFLLGLIILYQPVRLARKLFR